VLEGREGAEHEVETGVPQGSPAAPILFMAYVENECPGIQGLSFVDDVARWAERNSEQEVASEAADAALDWAGENGVGFDKAKTEIKTPWNRFGSETTRSNSTSTPRDGSESGSNGPQGTPFAEDEESPQSDALHSTPHGQMGTCPDACRRTLVAYMQASALYGAELWWDESRTGATSLVMGTGTGRDRVKSRPVPSFGLAVP